MRHIYLLLVSSILFTSAFGATSCQADWPEISKRVNVMYTAFAKQDIGPTVEMTDTSIIGLIGGREKFVALSKQAVSQMNLSGTVVEKHSVGQPSKTYMAETKSVCFIPVEMIMSIKGNKGRAISYLVAINRNTPGSQWLFLDGNGFKKRPEMLQQLIPGLPKDIQLPPVQVEAIK